MKAIFITGTDTGVGKTTVTGLLGKYLLEKGYRVVTQKWIQTGGDKGLNDIDVHLDIMKKRRTDYDGYIPYMEPYVFKFASSPHLASWIERRKISVGRIKRSFAHLARHFDFVIVEGSGGLLVPLGGKLLLIDVVRQMRLPVLLVSGNRLGAINSTLLSIEALESRRIDTVGVIYNNNQKDKANLILKDNPRVVKSLTGINTLGTLPYTKNIKLLYKRFAPIGDRIEGMI